MSVTLVVDIQGIEVAEAAISRLTDFDRGAMLSGIGAILESSTRRRIEVTKTSPDGETWAPNRAGTSTLLETGRHLRDSIAFVVGSDEVEVGSSWQFAHIHQSGATIRAKGDRLAFRGAGGGMVFAKQVTIPSREFVGLSAEDGEDVTAYVVDFLAGGFR